MSKQTAVEWLVEQIKQDQNQKALSKIEWIKVMSIAKEIEKEQIINAHIEGQPFATTVSAKAEQYYNETYGQSI